VILWGGNDHFWWKMGGGHEFCHQSRTTTPSFLCFNCFTTSSLLGLVSSVICSFHIDKVTPHISGVNFILPISRYMKRVISAHHRLKASQDRTPSTKGKSTNYHTSAWAQVREGQVGILAFWFLAVGASQGEYSRDGSYRLNKPGSMSITTRNKFP